MFYDLNITWSPDDKNLPRTLAFLHELGYNVVALNHNMTGKLPADLTSPIPSTIPNTPPGLTILTRCTLHLTTTHQNARIAELRKHYDILAARPIDERTLSLACSSLAIDIISLDLSVRLPFWPKHKMLAEAHRAGKKVEVCYAAAFAPGGDGGSGGSGGGAGPGRRNVIANATALIRATRGRGLVLSSEARDARGLRGPWDVVNLAAVWGLSQERAYEALSRECRSVVVAAKLARTGWRGVVDVVFAGEKGDVEAGEAGEDKGVKTGGGKKRKADVIDSADSGRTAVAVAEAPPQLSKRAMKRQRAEERQKEKLGVAAEGESTIAAGAKNRAKDSV